MCKGEYHFHLGFWFWFAVVIAAGIVLALLFNQTSIFFISLAIAAIMVSVRQLSSADEENKTTWIVVLFFALVVLVIAFWSLKGSMTPTIQSPPTPPPQIQK
jgi:dipeptide/tripeptide permease